MITTTGGYRYDCDGLLRLATGWVKLYWTGLGKNSNLSCHCLVNIIHWCRIVCMYNSSLCMIKTKVEIFFHTDFYGVYCQTNNVRFSCGDIAFFKPFSFCVHVYPVLSNLRIIENVVLNIDKKLWVYVKQKIISYIRLKCSYKFR